MIRSVCLNVCDYGYRNSKYINGNMWDFNQNENRNFFPYFGIFSEFSLGQEKNVMKIFSLAFECYP